MRRLVLTLSWLACALPAACGGGGGGGNPDSTALPGIYVNATTGDDDDGDGSFESPYKSIRRALFDAGIGEVVRVAAGVYDTANGEHFPIVPGFGVTIEGTEVQGPLGTRRLTRVIGGGFWSGDPDGRLHATIVPNIDNRLVSLVFENPQPATPGGALPAAVVLANSGVTVESCTLRDSDRGMRMMDGAHDTLTTDCTFVGNLIGVLVIGAGANNRVESCLIQGNTTGVMFLTTGADFGGDLAGSLGGNAFTANPNHDFVHFAGDGIVLYAAYCFWDHAPPTMSGGNPDPFPAADIWLVSVSSNVDAGGAQVYDPADAPLPPIEL